MFRRFACAFSIFAFIACPAIATTYTNPDGSQSQGFVPEINGKPVGPSNPLPFNGTTTSVESCAPVTTTFSAAGQSLSLPFSACPGAANYLITLTTPAGQTPLIGTMLSTDSTTGGTRRLIKTGQGNTESATEVLTGGQGASGLLEYRTVGGGYGQQITLTSYTSGQATVTILGLFNPTSIFVNGAVDTREDVAARQGRLYTASTGLQNVASGNLISMQFAIPTGANYAAYIVSRVFECNNTGTTVLEGAGVSNPTANLDVTPSSVTNRGSTGGVPSSATLTYDVKSTHPDTNPAATNPAGFFVQPGSPKVLGPEYSRVVRPGQTFANWIGGAGGGALTTAVRCYITYLWYEENIN